MSASREIRMSPAAEAIARVLLLQQLGVTAREECAAPLGRAIWLAAYFELRRPVLHAECERFAVRLVQAGLIDPATLHGRDPEVDLRGRLYGRAAP